MTTVLLLVLITGALHSQVGSKNSRHSEQDMKEALTHYQCSAGAFAYINASGSLFTTSPSPSASIMFLSFTLSLPLHLPLSSLTG